MRRSRARWSSSRHASGFHSAAFRWSRVASRGTTFKSPRYQYTTDKMLRSTGASSRPPLNLTEELEKLEQSITLTLQEIDSNFSAAHRIVTSSILPIVEQYAKHSGDVWDGSKFWKHFFEASANVSLSGYEEPAIEDETIQTDTTSTALDTPTDHDEYLRGGVQQQAGGGE